MFKRLATAACSPRLAGARGIAGLKGSLVVKCRDATGIVSRITDCIVSHRTNLTSVDMHIEAHANPDGMGVFTCRFGFVQAAHHEPAVFEREFMQLLGGYSDASASLLTADGRRVDFRGLAMTGSSSGGQEKGAVRGGGGGTGAAAARPSAAAAPAGASEGAEMRVVRGTGPTRVGICVSKTEHCVLELLRRHRDSELAVHIPFVLGNHEPSAHLAGALEEQRIKYYHVPTPAQGLPPGEAASLSSVDWQPWEAGMRDVLTAPGNETDLLVLARYMRVLSSSFLRWYATDPGSAASGFGDRPVVNIHHGLLPSFKGAAPYAQAHRAGVKVVGATAHFVTDELDEGPIIAQHVRAVSHRDDLRGLRVQSQALEALCLADAVRDLVQNRVCRVGGRVVVFS